VQPVAVASLVTATIVAEAIVDLPDIEPFVIASALAFLSGAVILLLGLLRVGWLVDLISLAAVHACTHVP
jgi:sodium-independent sulfate anion transporter 11